MGGGAHSGFGQIADAWQQMLVGSCCLPCYVPNWQVLHDSGDHNHSYHIHLGFPI